MALLTAILAVLVTVTYLLYQKIYLPRKYRELTQKILHSVIKTLDDERLAGQLIHIAIPGTEITEETRKILSAIKPGGIIFFGFNLQDVEQIKKFTHDLQLLAAELELPPFLISTDQEGGYVRRVTAGVLQTPPAMDLGATYDRELCRATGYHVSRDLGELGINVFFAPVVDINNNPQNPVIGLRSFGKTLEAVLGCALPFEQGARQAMRDGGALPVIKHFPGHGDTHTDSHLALPVIDKKIEDLRTLELVPFREAIRDGAQSVMTAHILYPQIDPDHPATLSRRWLSDILRGELGFTGLVFTDAMEMNAVSQNFRTLDRPVTAILSGADILLYTSWQEEPVEARSRLLAAIRSGALQMGITAEGEVMPLTRALKNQIRQKLRLLDISRYLSADEAEWYRNYTVTLQKEKPGAAVSLSKEDLQARFAKIQWSANKKKSGPIWLAGQKNPAKRR